MSWVGGDGPANINVLRDEALPSLPCIYIDEMRYASLCHAMLCYAVTRDLRCKPSNALILRRVPMHMPFA